MGDDRLRKYTVARFCVLFIDVIISLMTQLTQCTHDNREIKLIDVFEYQSVYEIAMISHPNYSSPLSDLQLNKPV